MCLSDKGQCLTLGGCKAPSRGEGQALPGGAGRKQILDANLCGDLKWRPV